MKKLLSATLITSVILLTACSEKDKAYYLKNIDKAETKKNECENKLKEAWKNKDEKAFLTLEKDAECKAANEAIKENRKIKAEQERQAKEAKARIEIDNEKTKLKTQLGQADWKGIVHYFVNSDCAKYGNRFSEKGFIVPEENYHCRAAVEIYQENAEIAKSELLKFSFDELNSQEKAYCSQDKRDYSACYIWEQALGIQAEKAFEQQSLQELEKLYEDYQMYSNKRPLSAKKAFEKVFKAKEQATIENYTKNYNVLKQDYNQCVEKVAQVGNHYSKYKERAAITDFYPCAQARTARSKLGLGYDDFKTLME
ncbi:MAG: hypothetical protein Q4B95_02825 [Lonepinella koalarum]|nr:hypothetical protein [Lonepinella koalarum]